MIKKSEPISSFPIIGRLDGNEYVPVVKNGINWRVAARDLAGLGSAAFYGAITVSPDAPSGGADGDIWFQVP